MPRLPVAAHESAWWRTAADALLKLARTLEDQGRIDSAWDALNCSRRLSLNELGQAELDNRAVVVTAEVDTKLAGWRRQAASAALTRTDTKKSYSVDDVALAQWMLDEESTSKYIRLKIAGRRLLIAALLLALTITGLWTATALGWFGGIEVNSTSFVLHDGGLFGGVLLLGKFGAMLSLALWTSRTPVPLKAASMTWLRRSSPLPWPASRSVPARRCSRLPPRRRPEWRGCPLALPRGHPGRLQ